MVVDCRRLVDVETGEAPKLRRRFVEERVIVDVGAVALVIPDCLRAGDREGLVIPARRFRPVLPEVRVREDVIGALLEGVIVRLVAGRTGVERSFAEPRTGFLRDARVEASATHRCRARVEPVREKTL